MTTTKLDFTEKVPCHPIDPIELTFVSAEWARIRILLKPLRLAISTQRLLARLALDRILQYVVADSAKELSQKSLHVLRVVDPILLEDVLAVHRRLVNYTLHDQDKYAYAVLYI